METSALHAAAVTLAKKYHPRKLKRLFERPLIIVSAPRCGSNLLFEQLSRVPALWTIGGECQAELMAFAHLRAENAAADSGRLFARHADTATRETLRAAFLRRLQNSEGVRYLDIAPASRPKQIRFLEKTPRNALNIPFLLKVFPDARFVFLYRDARQNVASLIEAWEEGERSGRFVTYNSLPGWSRGAWCFLLPPGWRALNGKSLVEICAFQWAACNKIVLDDLGSLPAQRWTSLSYQDLVNFPRQEVARLCGFAGLNADINQDLIPEKLPLSMTTLSAPDPDKWKRHETQLAGVAPLLDAVTLKIKEQCAMNGDR